MQARVVLIDDHQSFVDAIRLLLESLAPGIEVVATVIDPSRAVEVVENTRPDIVLLDMRFPNEDGVKVLLRLKELDECPRIIILSASSEVEDVRGALFAGAGGYITKDSGGLSVVAGINAVAAGMVVLSQAALTALRIQPSAIQLSVSARQLALLDLVGRGASDEEMVGELNISRATLQRELRQCVGDLGARNRTHAAVIAAQCGWI